MPFVRCPTASSGGVRILWRAPPAPRDVPERMPRHAAIGRQERPLHPHSRFRPQIRENRSKRQNLHDPHRPYRPSRPYKRTFGRRARARSAHDAQKGTTGRPVWDRPVVHSPWSFRSSPAEAVIGRAYSAPGISLASARGPTAEPSSPSREPASRPAPGSGCGSSAPSALRNPCRGSRSQQRSCSQAPRRGC